MNTIKILFIAALLLIASSVQAVTLRVDEANVHGGSCDDTHTYNEAQSWSTPLCTLQAADSIVQPGDTVLVADGTYNTVGGTPDGWNTLLDAHNGGSSGAWVTYEAEHHNQAILSGNNYDMEYGVFFRAGATYIKIIGFHLQEFRIGIDGNEGVNNHHYYIGFNVFDSLGDTCGDPGETNIDSFNNNYNGGQGIFLGIDTGNYTIDSNIFHDIGMPHPCLDSSISYQEYTHDHPMYLNGHDVVIINNITYNDDSGREIQMAGGSSTPANNANWVIANNTFASHNVNVAAQITMWNNSVAPPANVLIANNIFHDPGQAAIQSTYISGGAELGWTFENNLQSNDNTFFQIDNGTVTDYTETNNLTGSSYNPDFVDSSGHDYHLTSSSPAINAGTSISERTVDFDGNSPVGNPDIGAFEYTGSLPPPASTWHTDFSEYSTGVQPSGWTSRWHASNHTWTVQTGSGLGGKQLEDAISSGADFGMLSWDTPSSSADVEVLAKLKVGGSGSGENASRVYLRASGTDGAEYGYYCGINPFGDAIALDSIVNGSGVLDNWTSYTVNANTWYWIRFRASGTSLQCKVWADGDTEPASWNLTSTDSDITSAGWVGVGDYDYREPITVDYFSVANSGGTAPSPSAYNFKIYGFPADSISKFYQVLLSEISKISGEIF